MHFGERQMASRPDGFCPLLQLRGTDLDSIAGEVVDVCDLRGHSEDSVTWVLSWHASFVFCPSCRANAVFRQNFGNCFPTRFVVDQVGAHVFATVDWFLWKSCGYRDGQPVLWLDVKGLSSKLLDCAKALAMFLTVAWLALI